MLTSLLNIYIASNLQSDIAQEENKAPEVNSIAFINFNEMLQAQKKPQKISNKISPVIYGQAYLSMDLESESILSEKNMNQKLAIASITKLMTALVILEENSLDEVVKVSTNSAETIGSQMFLRAGEEITVKNLLYGLIIHSANDAAVALAEHNAGSVEEFVKKMNLKADSLSLNSTNFQNPAGLDHPNNYSTAADLSKLAKVIYENPLIQEIATIKDLKVTSIDGNLTHNLETTNDLLNSYLNIKGLKTGKTDAAGSCLISIAENDQGKKIITVVLNSPDRFRESKILIDWTFNSFIW